ncbi:prolyl-tRNA synthetase associated domain-containing 1 [Chlorella sorokiniana]|uniref:Prolyl-tRNA synthetase associated domain-containing 1 n=1 Tax=Chlorella sorokiniana TaxID=3076 RepID=A0A2P6TK53_CHLSO|nr:prolyl-tRNA synthetase associated domain-containing 1 [Chlorella sorokiniana]|eukprot:PRW44459.1 prolyl-tRNA synthetase associated domain-containing 1 [Chlorella sorokiniana]
MAALDQQALLAKLQQLNIAHENHAHGAVMTCDAQAQALAGVDGVVTKNLFLKDKKGRLYIITAAADTKVDLKLLSLRLGCGKGGLRMAPDDLLTGVLQVPLGSVTPLAVAQPSAAGVALLLDSLLQQQPRICVHPLDNRTTTVLSPEGLEAFLRSLGREPVSLGREPVWVDLEAEPAITKDNPPDLKPIADATAVLAPDEKGPAAVAKGETTVAKHTKAELKVEAAIAAGKAPLPTAAAAKPAAAAAKPAAAAAAGPRAARTPKADDVLRVTEDLVTKIATSLMGAEAAAAADPDKLRQLKADVAMELNALRNTAYAGGFAAAKGAMQAAASGLFA